MRSGPWGHPRYLFDFRVDTALHGSRAVNIGNLDLWSGQSNITLQSAHDPTLISIKTEAASAASTTFDNRIQLQQKPT
jgi:hypothetical protein